MIAVKGNREYTISEAEKDHYIKEGFDIFQDGLKIASGKGKTVSQEAYDKLAAELEQTREALGEAEKQLEEKASASDDKVVAVLKEYAVLKNIDIGSAASVGGILKKIEAGGT